jgi:hypothetical protein
MGRRQGQVFCMLLTVHDCAAQHTPLEHVEGPLQVMPQLLPVQVTPDEHEARPEQAM